MTKAVLLVVALMGLGFTGPWSARLQKFEAVEPHMGTLVRVTVYARSEDEARVAFRAGFERIRALDATLSDYKPDSELSRVTREAVRRPVRVSDDLFTVLRVSQRLARATGGAFDVTQGPVIRLWRDARRTRTMPDRAAIEAATRRSGHTRMQLDERARTVSFDVEGMALDVGAIGKGHAASEAIAAISRSGVDSALVAVSGDIACSDAPPGQPGWRIRIHDGDIGETPVPPILRLTHAAVSTSGNSEQHLDVGGTRYSHVIDPSSGQGLTRDITVTVVAPRGIDADGLDTAAGILGPEGGLALIEATPHAAGLIVVREGTQVTSQASRRLLELARSHPR